MVYSFVCFYFTVRLFKGMWLNASHHQSFNWKAKTSSMQFWKRMRGLDGRLILLGTLRYVFIQRIHCCLYLKDNLMLCISSKKVTEGIICYNSDSEDDLKKDVCDLKSYPPFVECVVQCTRRGLKGGRQRRVNLVFNKMQTGLEVTHQNAFMSFACTTFSEEPIGGWFWLRGCELHQIECTIIILSLESL